MLNIGNVPALDKNAADLAMHFCKLLICISCFAFEGDERAFKMSRFECLFYGSCELGVPSLDLLMAELACA